VSRLLTTTKKIAGEEYFAGTLYYEDEAGYEDNYLRVLGDYNLT